MDNEERHIAGTAVYFHQRVESKKHFGMLVPSVNRRATNHFLEYTTDLRLMLPTQGDQPHYRLVKLYRRRVESGKYSVLVGLQSFTEGLDLKGGLLGQIRIHKVAFPPVDNSVVTVESKWLKNLNRYSFEVQDLPNASFNLIQQVGRLVRGHHCWREVVIYDKCLLTKNYGVCLLNASLVFPIKQPGVPEVIAKRRIEQTAKQSNRERR